MRTVSGRIVIDERITVRLWVEIDELTLGALDIGEGSGQSMQAVYSVAPTQSMLATVADRAIDMYHGSASGKARRFLGSALGVQPSQNPNAALYLRLS